MYGNMVTYTIYILKQGDIHTIYTLKHGSLYFIWKHSLKLKLQFLLFISLGFPGPLLTFPVTQF